MEQVAHQPKTVTENSNSGKVIIAPLGGRTGSNSILNSKAKMTTIYTTTDRNGQVIRLVIFFNYS